MIAYPENCQSCGQRFVGCKGRSLEISFVQASYALAAARGAAFDAATPAAVKEATLAQPKKSAAEVEAAAAEGSGSGCWSGSKWIRRVGASFSSVARRVFFTGDGSEMLKNHRCEAPRPRGRGACVSRPGVMRAARALIRSEALP